MEKVIRILGLALFFLMIGIITVACIIVLIAIIGCLFIAIGKVIYTIIILIIIALFGYAIVKVFE